ncbi:hypothetical protein [uncultured Phenylobacterium sp.]|uniref:hypothetical protein n=1 Tax=uncultured Phenylobacterium sp. TaxID=349273 RepID=UPI0025F7A8AA|nr:hypothetical protein [uncultured Phenylobacterium sp.]
MTGEVEKAPVAAVLDDDALDTTVGAGDTSTGGRFMLDVAGHNVGYAAPTPPKPPTRG